MNIAQFLDALARTPHIEVIEAFLPNPSSGKDPKRGLRRRRLLPLAMHQPGKTLLDHLHHHRRIASLQLAHQQVEVLGHDHVTVNHELIPAPRLFQHLEKQVAATGCAQFGLTTVTTAGNKMQDVVAVKAVQPRLPCDISLLRKRRE
jgi:hypothetical protein